MRRHNMERLRQWTLGYVFGWLLSVIPRDQYCRFSFISVKHVCNWITLIFKIQQESSAHRTSLACWRECMFHSLLILLIYSRKAQTGHFRHAITSGSPNGLREQLITNIRKSGSMTN